MRERESERRKREEMREGEREIKKEEGGRKKGTTSMFLNLYKK